MDQKNTIVKCKAHPNCLFNHDGVCDNYVINIGADGKCESYVETARVDNFRISEIKEIAIYKPGSKEPLLTLKEPQRGHRAKCDFYEDRWIDPEIVKEVCQSFHLCDTKCKYWQLDSYSEWICNCMADDFNPHGYCPHYDDGGEE